MKDKGIQFQEGMSFYEFLEKYGTDETLSHPHMMHRFFSPRSHSTRCFVVGIPKTAFETKARAIFALLLYRLR